MEMLLMSQGKNSKKSSRQYDSRAVENVIPRIFNWQVVGIKVKYEKFMAESEFSPEITVDYSGKRPVVDVHSQADLDIQGFEDFSTVSPTEILKKAGLITDASASHPTKKRRTVRFDSTTAEEQDVEGCSEDSATVSVDALIEFMVNHNPYNTNAAKSTTVHVHNDHMIDYSSTLPESAQIELDAILKVIKAPVNDIPIEVVPPSKLVVNQHDISDSQLPPDFSDAAVAAHQAAKFPAKRTRTRFKVFKSLHTTEYTSGSKAIEDQIVEPKHKFSFDSFLISDNMPRGVIEEYKQWVEEELLKFHVKN
ncbi:hypothetical protein BC332_11549 [Capsicum chinense]|nr:hypothetical protein BC332_11549 [Capsicum chinense]